MATRRAHLSVKEKIERTRAGWRKASAKYHTKLLALGFPSGRTTFANDRCNQRSIIWNKANRSKARTYEQKWYQKAKKEFGTTNKRSWKWQLGLQKRAAKRLALRKKRAQEYNDSHPTT